MHLEQMKLHARLNDTITAIVHKIYDKNSIKKEYNGRESRIIIVYYYHLFEF